jgi:hypothetical protein
LLFDVSSGEDTPAEGDIAPLLLEEDPLNETDALLNYDGLRIVDSAPVGENVEADPEGAVLNTLLV